MRKKTRIAIFVDSRYRDTYGAVFVKRELQKIDKDWDILLVSFDLWQETLTLFRPHIAFLNHMIGKRSQLISSGVDYTVVMPTEGRPNTVEQLDWYVGGQDGKCDLFLSWNDPVAKKFTKTNVVITGSPRYDIYHDYPQLIDTKEKARAKFGLDPDQSTVGIFTSFPQAKFSFQNIEFNKRDWADLGVTQISNRKDPLAFAQHEYRERLWFLTGIASARMLDDHQQYLLKPHPMEDVLELQDYASRYEMKVVTQAPVQNVLAACDRVVNRKGCMTSLDAYLMGFKEQDILSIGEHEGEGLANFPGTLSEFVRVCGLHEGGAARRVAIAFANNLPKDVCSDRPYSFADRIKLEGVMVAHSRQHATPNPLIGAVGKAATSAYIHAIESIVSEGIAA